MQRQYANYGRGVIARCEGEDDGNPDNPARRIKRILALMARVSTLKPMESPHALELGALTRLCAETSPRVGNSHSTAAKIRIGEISSGSLFQPLPGINA